MRSVKTSNGHHAWLVGFALALMFTGAAPRGNQASQQPQALPAPRQYPQTQGSESPTQQEPGDAETLHVLVGRPLVVSSPTRIKRISVTDPSIVDAVAVSPDQILINGKTAGNASLVLWDEAGQSQEFYVSVDVDARGLPDQVRNVFLNQTAQAEARNWLGWVVAGSIALLAGVIIGARRQRKPSVNRFDQPVLRVVPHDGYNAPNLAVAPRPARAPRHPEEKALVDHGRTPEENPGLASSGINLAKQHDGKGVKPASPNSRPEIAERNARLLEAYLEAAHDGRPLAVPDSIRSNQAKLKRLDPLWDTITSLVFVVEAKGPYPKGHSRVVSGLAVGIATQLGLSPAEVEEIRLAGIVHDIGNLDVPEEMLMKPTPLTPEELKIMEKHAARGATMLEALNVEAIERTVRQHHERYDGTGYPDKLTGDAISLGARIVAVAECFHSMVSDLPYNSARTFGDALAELRRGSGTQFDPKAVTAFLDWIKTCESAHEKQRREDSAASSGPEKSLQPA